MAIIFNVWAKVTPTGPNRYHVVVVATPQDPLRSDFEIFKRVATCSTFALARAERDRLIFELKAQLAESGHGIGVVDVEA